MSLQHITQVQMPGRVAANAIAREQDRPTEQRVPRPLEINPLRQMLDAETMLGKPGVKARRLTLPFWMGEARAEEAVAEHQPRVGSEDEIGQPRLRRHQLDLHAELNEGIVQIAPLLPSPVRRGPIARLIHGLISYSIP